MNLKFYLTGLKRTSVRLLSIFALVLFAGITSAQVYNNGPISTGATSSTGVAAPAGTTWSEVQGTNVNAGFGANITAGLTVADNFTVCGSWTLSKITFYAYSTGYTGTTSPFNDVRVRIFNTDPSVGSPTPIFGDLTTNRFAASTFTNIYRVFPGGPFDQTRKVWAVEANVATTLATGNYWIEWQLGNGGLSNFSPAVTIVGATTQAGWNAKQNTLPNTWINLVDGTPAGPQDMPFRIDYTTAACTGTPTPGNTIASATTVCPGSPVALSLQNCTPGSGVTYQWQSATAVGGPYSNITGATNSTYGASPTVGTFYQALVTCGGNTATSTPVGITINPPSACFCIPPTSDCTDGDIITNVTLGTLNNNSTCGSATGYSSYVGATGVNIPNVIIGATNPISITAGTGTFTESVAVWIDYNNNGTFEASEFTLIGTGATPIIRTGNIVVPGTVTAGQKRMRVRVQFSAAWTSGQACTAAFIGFGETEDYTVNMVPCVPTTLTTQPTAQTIACGGSTTFTVALAGSLPVAYWEYRPNATTPWQNVPATAPFSTQNTTTLTLTNVPASFNGYQFRAVYSGACTGVDFSNAVTLTVTPYIAPISPVPAVKCTNSNLQLFASPPPTVTTVCSAPLNLHILDGNITGVNNTLNVSGIPAGATITNISAKLNVTHDYVADLMVVLKAPNGKIINLSNLIGGANNPGVNFTNTTFSSATGLPALSSGTSPGYTGTFRPDAALAGAFGIPTGPTGFTANTAVFSELSTVPNGVWTIAMYDAGAPDEGDFRDWCISITWGVTPATAVFTPTTGLFLDAAGTIPYTGTAVNSVYTNTATNTTYTATVSNGTCTSAPTAIPVTVTAPLTTVAIPAATAACAGRSTTITATSATGTPSVINYTWQVSTDGGTVYNTITNGATYSGATTSTLTILNATAAMSGYRYRAVALINACSATPVNSNATVLTVNPLPVLNVTASPVTALYPGQTTTLAVASTTTVPANGYVWTRNGQVVTGATGNTLVVDVDGIGEYSVNVADANGCAAAAAATITITDAANDILFIYPSPNAGQFQVRYFSAAGNNPLPRTLNVYDSKGSRVYSRNYTVSVPYTRMDVDIPTLQNGIYQVELTDRNGNRLKTGRVVIQK